MTSASLGLYDMQPASRCLLCGAYYVGLHTCPPVPPDRAQAELRETLARIEEKIDRLVAGRGLA